MAEPAALRTRIHVRFPEGTVTELDHDPGRSVGDLISAGEVAAFWATASKFVITGKQVDPGSDVDPPEIRYEVAPLGSGPVAPSGNQ